MKEGWLCPRCKKINAPWVSQCTCTEYHEKITTNTPIVGDPPFPYPNEPNWTPYYDTVKKTPTALYSSDKTTSTTGACSCSNKTESTNDAMSN